MTEIVDGGLVNDSVDLDSMNLPPVLSGHATPDVERKVKSYFVSVARLFEMWLHRVSSENTRIAYRKDVMMLMDFVGIQWSHESTKAFEITVRDVHDWFEVMRDEGKAPKTINRRISSCSSFYKFLAAIAAELRLPITVANPAHAQFIKRLPSNPVKETPSLSATRARQLCAYQMGRRLLAIAIERSFDSFFTAAQDLARLAI